MNLKHLSDKELLRRTEDLACKERRHLTMLLHHLIEIDSRRLYSALGLSSLYEYCMTELKHSESEACRRIDAMRLLQELPQIEQKILSGSLTMTNLNLARTFFRQEQKTKGEYSKKAKLEVLLKLEAKSTREARRELSKIAPVKARDQVRYVAENEVQLMASITPEALEKLERLKGLLAHSCPGMSFGELIEKLAELGLSAWDKSLEYASANKLPSAPQVKRVLQSKAQAEMKVEMKAKTNQSECLETSSKVRSPSVKTSNKTVHSRYIPAAVRRYIWRSKSCQSCGSDYALQIDHIVPMAMGGTSDADNLRLLCRHCNQRAAVEKFGYVKMEKYLNSEGAGLPCS